MRVYRKRIPLQKNISHETALIAPSISATCSPLYVKWVTHCKSYTVLTHLAHYRVPQASGTTSRLLQTHLLWGQRNSNQLPRHRLLPASLCSSTHSETTQWLDFSHQQSFNSNHNNNNNKSEKERSESIHYIFSMTHF